MGYGKAMLKLALKYAFQITGARAVQLNVFKENTWAKYCYESIGFVEKNIEASSSRTGIKSPHSFLIIL